ncbi:MAG: class I SAM-dependent methyltransferase [Labedaea sp.]
MVEVDPDAHARALAAESLADDDPTGWFERLYTQAVDGAAVVPWDRGQPHAMLVAWAERSVPDGNGRRAMVVGCGLGEDAEYLAGFGFDTVAFDVSPTAIRTARHRFPDSGVHYLTADLLKPPPAWRDAFDLVLESYTVQALPPQLHRPAIVHIGHMVAPGGTLVVIAAAEDPAAPRNPGPPWPLTRAEVDAFADSGLAPVRVEQIDGRWLAEFHRHRRGWR